MGRRQKSRRRYFEQRKNDIRKAHILKAARREKRTKPVLSAEASEMSSVLQQPDGSLLDRHHPNASFVALSEQTTELCDASWRIVKSDHNIQFFIVDGTSQPVITRSVTVETDLSWNVFINGKQLVVDGTPVLSDLSRQVPSMDVLSVLLERVMSSNICPWKF